MNRASIAKRITEAAEQSKNEKSPIMRCWLSDGTVKDMHLLETFEYNQGALIGGKVVYPEPYIERVECISGEQCAPQLIEVVEQMINGYEN